jgi:hypothetical protein
LGVSDVYCKFKQHLASIVGAFSNYISLSHRLFLHDFFYHYCCWEIVSNFIPFLLRAGKHRTNRFNYDCVVVSFLFVSFFVVWVRIDEIVSCICGR